MWTCAVQKPVRAPIKPIQLNTERGISVPMKGLNMTTILAAILSLLNSLGINHAHMFAGLAGAIVRTMMVKAQSKWETLTGGFVGTACAVYLTPILTKYFQVADTDLSTNNGIAFGIGLIGVYLAEGAIRMVQRWARDPKLPKSADLKGIVGTLVEDEKQEKDVGK